MSRAPCPHSSRSMAHLSEGLNNEELDNNERICPLYELNNLATFVREEQKPRCSSHYCIKGTNGSAARPVLVSRASRSALASYRKVTTCRSLCCAGGVLYLQTICLPLHDDPASQLQDRVLGA